MCINSFWPIDSYDRIRNLLESGARVNDADDKGRTPLMFVCWKYRRGDISIIIELLFSYQADVKRMDRFGWNALHFACRFNMTPQLLQVVEVLLRNHIDVDQTTKNGWNCLHYLCKYNTNERLKEIVIAFINRSIDVNAQTNNSKDTVRRLFQRIFFLFHIFYLDIINRHCIC